MSELRSICVNSQTPLLRFLMPADQLASKFWGESQAVPLEQFTEGVDYVPTAGGVTQVVRPVLMYLLTQGLIDKAHWLSIAPTSRFLVQDGRITMHGVALDPEGLGAYTSAKEKLWAILHGLPTAPIDANDFEAFARYNWESTRAMFRLAADVDLYYVHDFQQLQTGAMIGLAAPVVFRWHIPILLDRLAGTHRRFILRGLESFDSVIVSCRRDLEALIRAGYRGRAHQIYPVIDPARFSPAPPEATTALGTKIGIEAEDEMILCIARMDPMKGQDVLLRAFRKISEARPRARLVLAGNGSFTSSAGGGLGSSKGSDWAQKLRELARNLNVEKSTRFTGFLSPDELSAAYTRADVVVLPSLREGFGLVVPEAWMYSTPTVVSDGAGVSELVVPGQNGLTFPSGDADALSDRLRTMLEDRAAAKEMGRRGKESAGVCFTVNRAPDVFQVLSETHREYQ